MSSVNPLNNYISGNIAPLTQNSLVLDKVYGVVGVLNTVAQQQSNYQDPNSNRINIAVPLALPPVNKTTIWNSQNILDDVVNTNYTLTFSFAETTYVNWIEFDISSVPLEWALYRGSINDSNLITLGTVTQYDTTSIIHVGQHLSQTYKFDNNTQLFLQIVKRPTGTQYGISVGNLKTKIQVLDQTDITVSGSLVSNLVTTNRLGFAEKFTPSSYSLNNISDGDFSSYWKCDPQPVGDAIVYFVVDLGSLQTLNSMYLDPLYTDTVFNLYYSYDANYWYPVQRDFRLRKGLYELPTINARYIKFEFTQLTSEPYQLSLHAIPRIVNVFPTWIDDYYDKLEQGIPDIANQTYSQSNNVTTNNYVTGVNAKTVYGTAAASLAQGFAAGASIPELNSSSSITDPTVSYKTVQQNGVKGSTYKSQTDVSFLTRRFPYPGSHDYKKVDINHTWNQAYFTGLKNLLFFKTNYASQLDYLEFTDYLLSASGTNSLIASGTSSFVFNPVSLVTSTVSGSTFSTTSGGGYTGSTDAVLYTRNLSTLSQYGSFKMAVSSTDWQPFLSNAATTLQGTSFTGSPINAIVNNCTASTNGGGNGYGIFTISPSSNSSNYIESAQGGGSNLLTSAEANFTAGGWTTSTSSGVTTYSGNTNITVPNSTTVPWNTGLGNNSYGTGSYGEISLVPGTTSPLYSFLCSVVGTGTLTPVVSFTKAGGTTTTITGTTTTVDSDVVFQVPTSLFYQSADTDTIIVTIQTTGTVTLSRAGFYAGNVVLWSNPYQTQGMRVSAVARMYLPNTNHGTYRCSLMGYNGGVAVELARKQVNNLPIKTWFDLEIPFTLTTAYSTFSVRLTQINGQSEQYSVALLGTFYNPLSIEYCSDGTGTNWNYVINGVNDPAALINLRSNSNQLQFRFTALQDNTHISALSVIPNYTQNPLYSSSPIQYLGDSKTNELSWRRSPGQRPLFQVDHQFYPAQYNISVLMGIYNPFIVQ